MLIEQTLFGEVDKVRIAIDLIRQHEPPEGYYVAFSGGKDSCTCLDLVKRAGVKYKAYHNIVTIEPPELMKFIYKEYPEVNMVHTKKTMYRLIVENGLPPLRQLRYCHRLLKKGGERSTKILGLRAEESLKRANHQQFELSKKNRWGKLLYPILYWSTKEVWEYIHKFNVPYCKLYDEGRPRIGCLFCPFAKQDTIDQDLKRYPQIVRYLITACDRALKVKAAKGKTVLFKDGAEMFYWWINHDKQSRDPMKKLDYNLFS